MMGETRPDFSVIVPTFGRESHVHRLLASLDVARSNYDGKVEIIVVDSSSQASAQHIAESCRTYDAIYSHREEQSVRWKRNYGVSKSRFPIIMFIDSDCEVNAEIFEEHARIYESGIENLGGVYGLTRFVGERSFLWRIIEWTPFVDVFSFAEHFPYVQWAIGNNISYYKSVFDQVGGFDENFPFRLGGDDLDLSLRVTALGYLIKTTPGAIAYHSRDTWNSCKAILGRALRWGRMEYYVCDKHPYLLRHDLPRREPLFLLFSLFSLVLAMVSHSVVPIGGIVLWSVAAYMLRALLDQATGYGKPLFYHSLAQIPTIVYQLGCIFEYLRHRQLDILYKRMVFSAHHIRSIWPEEVRRLWASLLAFWIVLLFYVLTLW